MYFFSEAVGRKFAFVELIKRFKNRRKRRKKKNSEEKQGLLSKKRSHSDGEENIQDESDDFIALWPKTSVHTTTLYLHAKKNALL